MSIRNELLDAKLVERFKGALSPEMLRYLVDATNQLLLNLARVTPQEIAALAEARQQTERELAHLIAFVLKGDVSSPRIREEIEAREHRLAELDQQIEGLRNTRPSMPPSVDHAWVQRRIGTLHELLTRDPAGARREIARTRRRPANRARP
jgi:hypothetical protein